MAGKETMKWNKVGNEHVSGDFKIAKDGRRWVMTMGERSEEFASLAAAKEAATGWGALRAGSKGAKVAELIEGGETSVRSIAAAVGCSVGRVYEVMAKLDVSPSAGPTKGEQIAAKLDGLKKPVALETIATEVGCSTSRVREVMSAKGMRSAKGEVLPL